MDKNVLRILFMIYFEDSIGSVCVTGQLKLGYLKLCNYNGCMTKNNNHKNESSNICLSMIVSICTDAKAFFSFQRFSSTNSCSTANKQC